MKIYKQSRWIKFFYLCLLSDFLTLPYWLTNIIKHKFLHLPSFWSQTCVNCRHVDLHRRKKGEESRGCWNVVTRTHSHMYIVLLTYLHPLLHLCYCFNRLRNNCASLKVNFFYAYRFFSYEFKVTVTDFQFSEVLWCTRFSYKSIKEISGTSTQFLQHKYECSMHQPFLSIMNLNFKILYLTIWSMLFSILKCNSFSLDYSISMLMTRFLQYFHIWNCFTKKISWTILLFWSFNKIIVWEIFWSFPFLSN